MSCFLTNSYLKKAGQPQKMVIKQRLNILKLQIREIIPEFAANKKNMLISQLPVEYCC